MNKVGEVLVEVKRGGTTESVHSGHIAIVNEFGELLHAVGQPNRMTFARSTLKPIQTLPLIQSGAAERFLFHDRELSICCGSHGGEERHVQLVQSMLYRLGLEEQHLQCGSHVPYDLSSADRLASMGERPTALHNNCSGKHAGMLAAALHLQSDIYGYYKEDHPVQRRVLDTIRELAPLADDELETGIDGCGIPTFALPLHKLAWLYARLAAPDSITSSRSLQQAAARAGAAMMAYPDMVGGTGVACSRLMQALPGKLIAKGGAEGVYCVGLVRSKLGIAVKVDDGQARAAIPAVIEALRQLGELSGDEYERISDLHKPVIRNRREETVGRIEPVYQLYSPMEGKLV